MADDREFIDETPGVDIELQNHDEDFDLGSAADNRLSLLAQDLSTASLGAVGVFLKCLHEAWDTHYASSPEASARKDYRLAVKSELRIHQEPADPADNRLWLLVQDIRYASAYARRAVAKAVSDAGSDARRNDPHSEEMSHRYIDPMRYAVQRELDLDYLRSHEHEPDAGLWSTFRAKDVDAGAKRLNLLAMDLQRAANENRREAAVGLINTIRRMLGDDWTTQDKSRPVPTGVTTHAHAQSYSEPTGVSAPMQDDGAEAACLENFIKPERVPIPDDINVVFQNAAVALCELAGGSWSDSVALSEKQMLILKASDLIREMQRDLGAIIVSPLPRMDNILFEDAIAELLELRTDAAGMDGDAVFQSERKVRLALSRIHDIQREKGLDLGLSPQEKMDSLRSYDVQTPEDDGSYRFALESAASAGYAWPIKVLGRRANEMQDWIRWNFDSLGLHLTRQGFTVEMIPDRNFPAGAFPDEMFKVYARTRIDPALLQDFDDFTLSEMTEYMDLGARIAIRGMMKAAAIELDYPYDEIDEVDLINVLAQRGYHFTEDDDGDLWAWLDDDGQMNGDYSPSLRRDKED